MKISTMKNMFKLIMLFAIALVSSQLDSQNAINDKIQENSAALANSQLITVLETMDDNKVAIDILSSTLSQVQFLEKNKQALQSVKTNNSDFLRVNLPIEGNIYEFELFKATIATPDFVVATASQDVVDANSGLHYWGIVKDQPNSLVSLSIFEDEVVGTIHMKNGSFTIGKLAGTDQHILYKDANLSFTSDFTCEVLETRYPNVNTSNNPNSNASSANNCIRLHIEADYSLYTNKGFSITNTTNYVNSLISQVAIMFANESINIAISYLKIWDTPSPYGTGTELDDLTAQGFGTTYGDLVHLLHNNGGGGVAYLDVLCTQTFNTGVSNLYGYYNNVPTYSWDVMVVTHELGHNLGSPHTHACAWNGNNTAIDGCGHSEGYSEGCNGLIPPAGTIMSYCHLANGVGIDFNLGFGIQPGDLIRNRFNNANCLSVCAPPTCDDGYLNGNETDIDCGGPDCPACPSCVDGIQNGIETGIDCGGAECLPCSCDGGIGMSLIINPDLYVDETTWQIRDASGTIIASGGPYIRGSGTQIETICLPDGCYEFTIFDSYGDGLFYGGITGTYVLLDEYGTTLVSGSGNFGFSETSNFCVEKICATVDLSILFDDFPGQTSWDITDASGAIMASSGGYGSFLGSSTTTESTCLEDGCYTLNFYDLLNNGMCAFFGNNNFVNTTSINFPGNVPGTIFGSIGISVTPNLCGNYKLRDASGTVLASGGGLFGAQESSTFCLSGGTAQRTINSNLETAKTKDLVTIRPTLTSNFVNLDFHFDTETQTQIIVYGINGKLAMQIEYTANKWETIQMNVSNLEKGSYFIQMITNEGSVTKRFVKL